MLGTLINSLVAALRGGSLRKIKGSNHNDLDLRGTAGRDDIEGKKGNDIITGLGGDDRLDGGRGNDTAVYRGSFSDYYILQKGGKTYVFDQMAGRDGIDTLTSVEELRFSDRTIYLDGRNNAPIALNDFGTGDQNTSIKIDVLGNDRDFDGDRFRISHINGHSVTPGASIDLPAGGKVKLNADGTLNFFTNDDFDHLALGERADVSLTYTIRDAKGATGAATLNLTITGTNDAPVVVAAVTGGGAEGSGLAAVDLLQHATDVDAGATLRVENLQWTGNPGDLPAGFALDPDGTISVDTDNGAYEGLGEGDTFTATFTYDVVDEHGARAAQQATITITGTEYDPVTITPVAAGSGYNITDTAWSYYKYDHWYWWTGSNGAYWNDTAHVLIEYNPIYNGTAFEHVGQGSSHAIGSSATIEYSVDVQVFERPYWGGGSTWDEYTTTIYKSLIVEHQSFFEFDTDAGRVSDATLTFTPLLWEPQSTPASLPATIDIYAYAGNGQIDGADWGQGVFAGTASIETTDLDIQYVADLDEDVLNLVLQQGDVLGFRFAPDDLLDAPSWPDNINSHEGISILASSVSLTFDPDFWV